MLCKCILKSRIGISVCIDKLGCSEYSYYLY